MQPIEIITIIVCVLIVGGVLGTYIYRKIKHKPTGGCSGNCSCCSGCSSCASIKPKEKKNDEESKSDSKGEA